jgi:hypothetical protein
MTLRLALVALVLAFPLPAQLVVRVEAGGIGLSGAEVGIWNDSTRLAGGRTDALGSVQLRIRAADRVGIRLTVRRMGFLAVQRALQGSDTVVIALVASATPLPALAVQARTLRCPVQDDPEARALWQAAAGRFAPYDDRLHFGYVGRFTDERVPAESRSFGDELDRGFMGFSPAGHVTALLYRTGDTTPYAMWTTRHGVGGTMSRWWYTPVHEGAAASHFASARFGATHAFTMLGVNGDARVLGFCALDTRGPEIEGEMQIDADSTLRAARWQFRVPRDDEDAGGEVWFGMARHGGQRYLIGVRGSRWARADRGHYEQHRYELLGWRLGSTPEESRTGWVGRGDLGAP